MLIITLVIFMFSMDGARLWVFMEFLVDMFLEMNCQAVGLVDTMIYTFDCLIGTTIMITYDVKQLPKS